MFKVLYCVHLESLQNGADDEQMENWAGFKNERSSFEQIAIWDCQQLSKGLIGILCIFCPTSFIHSLQKVLQHLENRHRARTLEEGIDVETAGDEVPRETKVEETILKWPLTEN